MIGASRADKMQRKHRALSLKISEPKPSKPIQVTPLHEDEILQRASINSQHSAPEYLRGGERPCGGRARPLVNDGLVFAAEGEGSQEVDAITETIYTGPGVELCLRPRRPASDPFPSRILTLSPESPCALLPLTQDT